MKIFSGDLHFLNIERSDEGPNYSCGIWNEKIQRFAKGTTYTVEIIGTNLFKYVQCVNYIKVCPKMFAKYT